MHNTELCAWTQLCIVPGGWSSPRIMRAGGTTRCCELNASDPPLHSAARCPCSVGVLPCRNNNFKHMFPGLKPAVAIFATYCAVEFVYDRMFPAKHEHHHAPEPFEGSR